MQACKIVSFFVNEMGVADPEGTSSCWWSLVWCYWFKCWVFLGAESFQLLLNPLSLLIFTGERACVVVAPGSWASFVYGKALSCATVHLSETWESEEAIAFQRTKKQGNV